MGELLQALRTFAHLRESDTTIEEGEVKEFLRGTFSMMEFDENSRDQLDQLKTKFMRIRKEMNGLDMEEFEDALKPMTKGVSQNQIITTFRKMDPMDEGEVTWNDFINFAIEEHSKRLQMHGTMDEMPFGKNVVKIKHQHRDPIMKISFMPTVETISRHVDWGIGKYMVLSREGLISLWSSRMRNKGYFRLFHQSERDPPWYTEMVAMYHNNFIAVATTARDISFFDYTQQGWIKKYCLRKLAHTVTCMSYWAGLSTEQIAVLCWGDTSGTVSMIEFELADMSPMFGIRIREVCNELSYPELVKGTYSTVTLRVFPVVHKDWVKEVKYIPEATSVVSCCMNDGTALYMTHVDTSKKTPAYFNALKGVLCFDYSHELNILAAAGIDCNIWLYNPYIPHKVVAVMEGHVRPVAHLKINPLENYCISIDLSKTILISNLSSQKIIMRIPGQSVRMGNIPINAVYLNSVKRMCLLGAYGLCMLKMQEVEGLNVEVRSHDHKLVGALYSPPFEQVVSVCRGSMVRVWDIITGTRVMQFAMAHSKKVQGRWVPIEIDCIGLSENKKRLFTAAEGVIKIWNFSVGVVLRTLDMSNCQKIQSIVMAKSLIYVTGWNKYINVFSDFKGEEAIKKTWVTKHNEDCLSLCVMEPNLIASSSYDGSIIVWSRETQESYCKLSASFSNKPELDTAVRTGGNKKNIMAVAADMDAESDDGNEEEQGEDAFMTIGKHLRKEGGWYRLLRALKKRQIEREKRRAAIERRDFSAKYKKKKKRMNMQGLSLVYESAVETLVFLEARRQLDPHTATLVAGGAECWIRFWSLHPKGGLLGQFCSARRKLESVRCMTTDKQNEYLFTGDTMGLLRVWDIKEFCNVERLSPEAKEARDKQLRREFVYNSAPFKPEEILDTMEKLREKRISVPDASKPRKNLQSPRLLSSIRCHTGAIVSVEFIEDRNVILTASQDLTVRLWTKNCTYIGTFGETWKPLPHVVGKVVEKKPRIPKDIIRCASARSLYTLHNGHCPHWKSACYIIRRHTYELRRERQMEEQKEKTKEERRARGEVCSEDEVAPGPQPASKILGKYYTPRKRYMGPISITEQGLPPLRIFQGHVSPYHTTRPREFYTMVPLYRAPTFFDIDTRRPPQWRSKRVIRHMMNQFNSLTGDPVRYGHHASRSTSTSEAGASPTAAARSRSSVMDSRSPSASASMNEGDRSSRQDNKSHNKSPLPGDRSLNASPLEDLWRSPLRSSMRTPLSGCSSSVSKSSPSLFHTKNRRHQFRSPPASHQRSSSESSSESPSVSYATSLSRTPKTSQLKSAMKSSLAASKSSPPRYGRRNPLLDRIESPPKVSLKCSTTSIGSDFPNNRYGSSIQDAIKSMASTYGLKKETRQSATSNPRNLRGKAQMTSTSATKSNNIWSSTTTTGRTPDRNANKPLGGVHWAGGTSSRGRGRGRGRGQGRGRNTAALPQQRSVSHSRPEEDLSRPARSNNLTARGKGLPGLLNASSIPLDLIDPNNIKTVDLMNAVKETVANYRLDDDDDDDDDDDSDITDEYESSEGFGSSFKTSRDLKLPPLDVIDRYNKAVGLKYSHLLK